MLPSSVRRAAVLALVVVALPLTACQTQPEPEPTLTPRSEPMLEPFFAECGAPVPAPAGDVAFAAELAVTDAAGMRVTLDITAAGGEHGQHELGSTDIRIVDTSGRVAGVVIADALLEAAGLRGTLEVEVGSCAGAPGAVESPLADGEYAIAASGTIRPLDHDHAQAETWIAEPVVIVVQDSAIQR